MSRKKKTSQTRALKKHMRKTLGVQSLSDRMKASLKAYRVAQEAEHKKNEE